MAMVNGYSEGIRGQVALGDKSPQSEPAPIASSELAPPRFEDIYVCHFDFVCRSLRLLGVASDAVEDAAQDVFGVVARRLGGFVRIASIKTWLFAISQRVAANQRRLQRRKRSRTEPLIEPLIAGDASPEAQAEAARAAALIEAFAATLNQGHRAVLVLGLIEQVAPRELAIELGIPLNTVYSRMRSVRDGLRVFLQQRGVST